MESLLENWSWATPDELSMPTVPMPDQASHATLTGNALPFDLLQDLALPSSSNSFASCCNANQTLPSFDEDMFWCLDDFILYPDDAHSEELRLFDNTASQRLEVVETTAHLSPVSSITESLPSPATSYISSIGASTPQEQYNDNESGDQGRSGRRRRNSTVFPCTLCERVCHTSVEARYLSIIHALFRAFTDITHRRHHARHVKPFKCPEPPIVPLHPQPVNHIQRPPSPPQMASQSSERSRCEKAFATKNELERHRKSVHYCIPEVGPKEWFKCPIEGCKIAERLWPRRDNLLVHMKQSHPHSVGMDLR